MLDAISRMDAQTLAASLSAVATFLAFLATAFSAYAALRGPTIAAELAERMRQETEISNEKRRVKLHIFGTLMQERAAWYTPEAVKAFNLIDVAFIDNMQVREAWTELYASVDTAKGIPEHEKNKRFRTMLAAMAADLKLVDGLRLDDFERVYFPVASQEELQLRILQRQAALRQLTGNTSPSSNAASPQLTSIFPPPPTQG